MSDRSGIEWTDATLNLYTGCTKVSPGCDNCYMFAQYPRLRGMGVRGYERAPDVVSFLPERIEQVLRWIRPRMVFLNSMSDTFHPHADYGDLDAIFDVLIEASELRGHVFQVLTKRPGRAAHWWKMYSESRGIRELPVGIWMGTSVESQKYAPRIDVLGRVAAKIRFVSAEPLLSELRLEEYMVKGLVDWVIVGGESGRNARDMDEEWARVLRDECRRFGVSFFLKQLGGVVQKRGGLYAALDGLRYNEFPALGARVGLEAL